MDNNEVKPFITSKYVIFDRNSKTIVYPARGSKEFYEICELKLRLELIPIPELYDRKNLENPIVSRTIRYDKTEDKYYVVERTELENDRFQDKYEDMTPEIKLLLAQLAKINLLQTDFTTQLHVKSVLFDEIYKYLVSVRSSDKYGYGMILLDIDDFKKVNDKYGHDIGDDVLREVSDITKSSVRFEKNARLDVIGTVGRYGGEEIGILLKNTTPEGLWITAERIRKNIESKTLTVPVTVSVGAVYSDDLQDIVSQGLSTNGTSEDSREMIQKMFARADAAMYKSKRLGKNRVTIWSRELDDELNKNTDVVDQDNPRTL